jgi:hypothetical protein
MATLGVLKSILWKRSRGSPRFAAMGFARNRRDAMFATASITDARAAKRNLLLAMTGFAALLSGWCSAAEFGENCAYTLAEYGVTVKTTCADRWTNPETGKTYCFINQRAQLEFLKDRP